MEQGDFRQATELPIDEQPRPVAAKRDEPSEQRVVAMHVQADNVRGELQPIWRFFGADEPNYAYMPAGQHLLAELGQLCPRQTFFRTHNLLTSGDGTPALKWGSTGVYSEDAQGNPLYNWTIVDRIFDTYLERQVKPYVQIGFMPHALSVRPEPYQHSWQPGDPYDAIYTGWAYPPKDDAKWAELVYQWTKHCVETYGRSEVESWYWQVWNEPNIGYWRGTEEQFFNLHDQTIRAVRRALPTAKVGGPDSAGGGAFLRSFLTHSLRRPADAHGEQGTPLDFISFHAKGAPTFIDGHVRMGVANHLQTIDSAFGMIASFPELKGTPIVIGESDPDGCAACSAQVYPQNAYRNGALYASYTAASFARKHDLAAKHNVNLEGALTWAFEFEDQPLFAGFRVLATNDIALPVLNVFRMFAQMSGQRVAVESDGAVALNTILQHGVRDAADVAALASLDDRKLCVMVWHYHDDDVPGPVAAVELTVHGLNKSLHQARLTHYQIDDEHSNAYTAWQKLGSPREPTPEQRAVLLKAAELALWQEPQAVNVHDGQALLRCTLPRQSVALLRLEW